MDQGQGQTLSMAGRYLHSKPSASPALARQLHLPILEPDLGFPPSLCSGRL